MASGRLRSRMAGPITRASNQRQQSKSGRCRRRSRGSTSSRELRSRRIAECNSRKTGSTAESRGPAVALPEYAAAGNRGAQPGNCRPAPQQTHPLVQPGSAGAGAQPATGTAAGAEIQSMATTAAGSSSACQRQPSRPAPPPQVRSRQERPLTPDGRLRCDRFAGDAFADHENDRQRREKYKLSRRSLLWPDRYQDRRGRKR